jgi:hypothetical protein
MSEHANGAPAFSSLKALRGWQDKYGMTQYDVISNGGMSLRDFFAARAFGEILSELWFTDADFPEKIEDAAQKAYVAADAMLKAREA